MNLFVDIETIPDQRQGAVEAAVALVKAPANYKDADKISAYKLEQAQEAYAKTALDGGRGQIVSIACAIDDMEPVVFSGSDERANLSSFIRYVDKAVNQEGECLNYCLIGHNLLGFDLRFIWQRCVVTGIEPPNFWPINERYNGHRVYDTMIAWSGYGNRISQKNLCAALNIPCFEGDEIEGSQVWAAYQEGRLEDIVKHNVEDVKRLRLIYNRLNFLNRDAF